MKSFLSFLIQICLFFLSLYGAFHCGVCRAGTNITCYIQPTRDPISVYLSFYPFLFPPFLSVSFNVFLSLNFSVALCSSHCPSLDLSFFVYLSVPLCPSLSPSLSLSFSLSFSLFLSIYLSLSFSIYFTHRHSLSYSKCTLMYCLISLFL